ncbi:MAG: hypothetical protein LQ349_005619 [Xanthoria aureola]|nr:MAG: hypothetical protein LQ349_005619 [Xanthoria aureola]
MAEVDFQSLVESNLMSSGEFTNAIIIGHDGERWASSDDLTSMPTTERKGLASLWNNKALSRRNGFSVLGKKYTCKTIDDDNLVGAGSEGLVVGYKSEEAITLGVVTKGQPQGLATIQIVGLGEYFKQNGY